MMHPDMADCLRLLALTLRQAILDGHPQGRVCTGSMGGLGVSTQEAMRESAREFVRETLAQMPDALALAESYWESGDPARAPERIGRMELPCLR